MALLMCRVTLFGVIGKHPVSGRLCTSVCMRGVCTHSDALEVNRKHPHINIQICTYINVSWFKWGRVKVSC